MAKKYYAVRVGKVPGVYQTWDECKKNVHGFPAAEYKSFMSMEEANAYMGREAVQEINGKTGSGNMEDVMPDNDYAFVDGSFNIATLVFCIAKCINKTAQRRNEKERQHAYAQTGHIPKRNVINLRRQAHALQKRRQKDNTADNYQHGKGYSQQHAMTYYRRDFFFFACT